jgi:hypothetical protein
MNQIVHTRQSHGWRPYDTRLIRFGPRLDADFFPDDSLRMLLQKTAAGSDGGGGPPPPKPTLIGATDAEYLVFGKLSRTGIQFEKKLYFFNK